MTAVVRKTASLMVAEPAKREGFERADGGVTVPGASRVKRTARAKLDPRERLLEAATTLFCQRGFNAVGVDAIVEEAQTAKTTLYKLFGSKDTLVEAVLDREGQAWRDWFMVTVTSSGNNPRDRLKGIFPALILWFHQKRFYGCPFINAVGEHDKNSDRMRTLALNHKREVLDFIRSLCRGAGAANPERLTHDIALLIDGAIVAAMITRDPSIGFHAQHAFDRLFDAELRLSEVAHEPSS